MPKSSRLIWKIMNRGSKIFISSIVALILDIAPFEAPMQMVIEKPGISECLNLFLIGFGLLGLAALGRRIVVNKPSSF